MFERGFTDPDPEDFGADEVGKKAVGEDGSDQQKDRVFEQADGGEEAFFIAFEALCRRAFEPVFDRSKEEFHVDRLRAGPSAPNAAK